MKSCTCAQSFEPWLVDFPYQTSHDFSRVINISLSNKFQCWSIILLEYIYCMYNGIPQTGQSSPSSRETKNFTVSDWYPSVICWSVLCRWITPSVWALLVIPSSPSYSLLFVCHWSTSSPGWAFSSRYVTDMQRYSSKSPNLISHCAYIAPFVWVIVLVVVRGVGFVKGGWGCYSHTLSIIQHQPCPWEAYTFVSMNLCTCSALLMFHLLSSTGIRRGMGVI